MEGLERLMSRHDVIGLADYRPLVHHTSRARTMTVGQIERTLDVMKKTEYIEPDRKLLSLWLRLSGAERSEARP